MPKRLLLLIILTIFATTGCSKSKVSYRYIQPTDLSLFATYSWQDKAKQSDTNTQELSGEHNLIQKSADLLFSEKGYSISQDPDFFVSYEYSTRKKHKNILSVISIGIGSFGRYCGVESTRWANNQKYEQGLLVIELMDAKKRNIFWKATLKGPFISNNKASKTKNNYVTNMVQEILHDFPST